MLLGGLHFSCTNPIEGQLQVQPAGRPQAPQPFYALQGGSSRHCLLHYPAPLSESLRMIETSQILPQQQARTAQVQAVTV